MVALHCQVRDYTSLYTDFAVCRIAHCCDEKTTSDFSARTNISIIYIF